MQCGKLRKRVVELKEENQCLVDRSELSKNRTDAAENEINKFSKKNKNLEGRLARAIKDEKIKIQQLRRGRKPIRSCDARMKN